MKQKRKFGGMLGVMLLGVFALTSCVQDDMYELYDDGFESGFVRSKKRKDNGGVSESELNYARLWIASNAPIDGECVATTICSVTSKSITEVRNLIGPEIFGNSNWEVSYVRYVQKGGIPGENTAISLINKHCNMQTHTSDWESYKASHMGTDDQGHDTITIAGTIVAQVGGQHWGVLTGLKKVDGVWQCTVGGTTFANPITNVLW